MFTRSKWRCAASQRHLHHLWQPQAPVTSPASQRIEILRPGNTTVSIVIHDPLTSITSSSPAAVLFFPRGSLLEDPEVDEEVVRALRSTLGCHVIEVNYRFGKAHQHPSAVYDATAAFDWTVENVLQPRSGQWRGKSARSGRIAVCGELLGGNLATMLSLTECRKGEPGIVAAAVNNAVFDWVDLRRPQEKGKRRSKRAATFTDDQQVPSLKILEELRREAFRKPEAYYDSFASPMLFFRSAGSSPPAASTVSQAGQGYDLDYVLHDHDETHADTSSSPNLDTTDDAASASQPRTSRQFPSRAHGLALPAFHLTCGSTSLFAPQMDEFARQYSESVLRQRKARITRRARWYEDGFEDHDPMTLLDSASDVAAEEAAFVASRVQSKVHEGCGLWSSSVAGRAMIHDMASWLAEQLNRTSR